MIKWNVVFKRLMTLMDIPGASYFSGSRFIRSIQQFDENLSDYSTYIDERSYLGKSTTRRVFFQDILMDLEEGTRVRAVLSILDELEIVPENIGAASEIRKLLGGGILAPNATIPPDAWNGDRLNDYLSRIDSAISTADYNLALTLCYTCLEGFYGAFLRAKTKRSSYPNEIIELSKEVKILLKGSLPNCPGEILNSIGSMAFIVDRSRNQFSESHFANEAKSWLATYVRDLTNSQIRFLLHFM